jgi:hypothetical protein
MRSPSGAAAIGLLAGSLLLGASSAADTTINLLEDKREVYIVGWDYFPPAPYAAWDFTQTVQGYIGEQTSSFSADSFVGDGYVWASEEETAADPEVWSDGLFRFEVTEITAYKLEGSLWVTLHPSNVSVYLHKMDGIYPIETIFGKALRPAELDPLSYQIDFEKTVVLPAGMYELSAHAYTGYYLGANARWDVQFSIDPNVNVLPGAPPLAVAMALLAAWALWGRRAVSGLRRDRP